MLPAGPNVGDPQREAVVRGGDDLDVARVVVGLARPPQVHALRRAGHAQTVGLHESAVDDHMVVAGHLRGDQSIAQVRRLPGQQRATLVDRAIAHAPTDPVILTEPSDPGAVAEPADHDRGLVGAAELPPPVPRADALAFRGQETDQTPERVIADGQVGDIWDAHRDAGPLGSDLWKDYFLPRPRVSPSTTPDTPPARHPQQPDAERDDSLQGKAQWDVDPETLVGRACKGVSQPMTKTDWRTFVNNREYAAPC
ncbi:hypothetical protein FAIPA1_140029 [Frankia sp. AiPs1]